mmetsp:Transcript_59545/g.184772  ORF Transcript_59545/g.184772 Transcript_59545/m.184772 type:complete len:249 (+) Transcript_59545:232-978(+)
MILPITPCRSSTLYQASAQRWQNGSALSSRSQSLSAARSTSWVSPMCGPGSPRRRTTTWRPRSCSATCTAFWSSASEPTSRRHWSAAKLWTGSQALCRLCLSWLSQARGPTTTPRVRRWRCSARGPYSRPALTTSKPSTTRRSLVASRYRWRSCGRRSCHGGLAKSPPGRPGRSRSRWRRSWSRLCSIASCGISRAPCWRTSPPWTAASTSALAWTRRWGSTVSRAAQSPARRTHWCGLSTLCMAIAP